MINCGSLSKPDVMTRDNSSRQCGFQKIEGKIKIIKKKKQ